MSSDRKHLVGWTYDPEPDADGMYNVYTAAGGYNSRYRPNVIGIPAPRPPRTGTLGLSEEDTRENASVSPIETPARHLSGRIWNATIRMCRADVARWDAEDEAAHNAVPDTLTVELPVGVIRHAVKWWGSGTTENAKAVADACRTALDEAGLA